MSCQGRVRPQEAEDTDEKDRKTPDTLWAQGSLEWEVRCRDAKGM